MATISKTEPMLDTTSAPSAPIIETSAPAQLEPGSRLDQLSRVEDKVARVEEKFARAEERMMRVESALEKATIRLEGATQDMNLQSVRQDIASMRDELRRKPGAATIFIIALIAAALGAVASFALLRYGVPGIIPGILPR